MGQRLSTVLFSLSLGAVAGGTHLVDLPSALDELESRHSSHSIPLRKSLDLVHVNFLTSVPPHTWGTYDEFDMSKLDRQL